MTIVNEDRRPGEFVLSEAEHGRSRDNIVIASGSGVIEPGMVLGRFTSGANEGKYAPSLNAAADPDVGQQVAVAVALYGCDATEADATIAGLTRAAQVKGHSLSYDASVDDANKVAAKATQLRAAGIVVR